MPATAPATSSVLRSPPVRWKYWAISEPIAPPVMMIGPSAPNGPPLPIAMPEASGFSTATLGDIALSLNRIASIASGMPWPRICSVPKRAIRPMIRAADHRHRDHLRPCWSSPASTATTPPAWGRCRTGC
jgi:hypothetical protein